jgi:hypothetical protein
MPLAPVASEPLAPLFQQGKCLTDENHFAASRFPVVVAVDLTNNGTA